MKKVLRKNLTRKLRKAGVRAAVRSAGSRPRLSVFRSNQMLYVQLIDDKAGKTLVSGSLKEIKAGKTRVLKAHALGKMIAERAKKAGISTAVFDRGSYAYHGRVKALAEGAREGGLKL